MYFPLEEMIASDLGNASDSTASSAHVPPLVVVQCSMRLFKRNSGSAPSHSSALRSIQVGHFTLGMTMHCAMYFLTAHLRIGLAGSSTFTCGMTIIRAQEPFLKLCHDLF